MNPNENEITAIGTERLVCNDIATRQQKGIAKYGVSVADNPLPIKEWLRHAYEECLDRAVYLKRAIDAHVDNLAAYQNEITDEMVEQEAKKMEDYYNKAATKLPFVCSKSYQHARYHLTQLAEREKGWLQEREELRNALIKIRDWKRMNDAIRPSASMRHIADLALNPKGGDEVKESYVLKDTIAIGQKQATSPADEVTKSAQDLTDFYKEELNHCKELRDSALAEVVKLKEEIDATRNLCGDRYPDARAIELIHTLRAEVAKFKEPEITINGAKLSTAQAMVVRVAISSFEPDCGDDIHGHFMTAAYRKHLTEIIKFMSLNP